MSLTIDTLIGTRLPVVRMCSGHFGPFLPQNSELSKDVSDYSLTRNRQRLDPPARGIRRLATLPLTFGLWVVVNSCCLMIEVNW